jgi:hypothetical protein
VSDIPGIHAALADAAGRIGALAKTEKNREQGFMFRSIDAILAASKPVFAELGISVTPRVLEKEYQEVQSSKGTKGWRCTCTMEYTFSLGSDGSQQVTSMAGEAIDYGDKATTKAEQMAYKYALTQVLQIGSTEADPDSESHEIVTVEEPPVDLAELIRVKVALFTEWTEDERRDIWITHSQTVLGGKPQTPSEVDLVIKSMGEQYYEQFPPSDDQAPF